MRKYYLFVLLIPTMTLSVPNKQHKRDNKPVRLWPKREQYNPRKSKARKAQLPDGININLLRGSVHELLHYLYGIQHR